MRSEILCVITGEVILHGVGKCAEILRVENDSGSLCDSSLTEIRPKGSLQAFRFIPSDLNSNDGRESVAAKSVQLQQWIKTGQTDAGDFDSGIVTSFSLCLSATTNGVLMHLTKTLSTYDHPPDAYCQT